MLTYIQGYIDAIRNTICKESFSEHDLFCSRDSYVVYDVPFIIFTKFHVLRFTFWIGKRSNNRDNLYITNWPLPSIFSKEEDHCKCNNRVS